MIRQISFLIANKNNFYEVFNVGGGLKNTISVIEVVRFLEDLVGYNAPLYFDTERIADLKVYVTNINKTRKFFNWEPKIDPIIGITKTFKFIKKYLDIV